MLYYLLAVLYVVCAFGTGTAPALRVRTFRFVDASRTIRLPDGRHVSRPLTTVVRYPATRGPHPLIVFAHGFALTPGTYSRLLRAWTRAGYVVAAPVFPLEDANAPGGPDESDLVNDDSAAHVDDTTAHVIVELRDLLDVDNLVGWRGWRKLHAGSNGEGRVRHGPGRYRVHGFVQHPLARSRDVRVAARWLACPADRLEEGDRRGSRALGLLSREARARRGGRGSSS